jgi:hypothetical protein
LTAPSAHAQNVVAKRAGAVRYVSKTLNVSPKFANPKNMNRTCAINSARPVLSSAELLRRYVDVANIANQKAPPKVIKACPGMVRKAVMASGAGSKAANAENVKRACANARGRPILATAGYLSRMTAGVRCVDRTMKSKGALQFNPKVANQKNARTACANAKQRPAIAVRNFLPPDQRREIERRTTPTFVINRPGGIRAGFSWAEGQYCP